MPFLERAISGEWATAEELWGGFVSCLRENHLETKAEFSADEWQLLTGYTIEDRALVQLLDYIVDRRRAEAEAKIEVAASRNLMQVREIYVRGDELAHAANARLRALVFVAGCGSHFTERQNATCPWCEHVGAIVYPGDKHAANCSAAAEMGWPTA